MLETLSLRNLGPAPALDFEFGEGLNLITGDNGLGKTFLLDVAWWALTRCWTEGRKIHPAAGVNDASVSFHVHGTWSSFIVGCWPFGLNRINFRH